MWVRGNNSQSRVEPPSASDSEFTNLQRNSTEGVETLSIISPLESSPELEEQIPQPKTSNRSRGRPKGSQNKNKVASVAPSLAGDSTLNQLIVVPQGTREANGAMTRARRALLMDQMMGMTYECSDEEALRGIASQIQARRS